MSTPTVTVAEFRANFPEFSSQVTYPDSLVNFWLTFALRLLNQCRWLDIYTMGVQLFVAHNLALEKQAQDSAKTGATPGVTTGPVSGKGVGKVRVDYASAEATISGAGHWNLTTYGTRYLYFARIVGMGPIQVNVGATPLYNSNSAWAGPYPGPGPTGFSNG